MKILLICLCSLSFYVAAATVNTNQSAALVNPSEDSEWQQTQSALAAVLSKKSGLSDTQIRQQFSIDESFNTAILRRYHERVAGQSYSSDQWFNLIVDDEKMHRLMLNQRIPIWPDRRGVVYVWVVEEKADNQLEIQDNHSLAHANITSESVIWLKKWFDVMGVPTQFYDAQAEDLLTFQPKDVRYLNQDLIDYLHAENDISRTLLVFIKHSSNGFSYRFGLSELDQQPIIKNMQFVDMAGGMKALASSVQSILAEGQRLYADEFSDSTVSVTINDIPNADAMLSLLNYLDHHALVEEYQVNQLKSKQLSLMTRIKVLPETFIKFVENEGLLIHQPIGIGNSLLFKWASSIQNQ